MALNPIVFTEKVVRSFLRYQLTAYPFAHRRKMPGRSFASEPCGARR
jgi:hypothetical protein